MQNEMWTINQGWTELSDNRWRVTYCITGQHHSITEVWPAAATELEHHSLSKSSNSKEKMQDHRLIYRQCHYEISFLFRNWKTPKCASKPHTYQFEVRVIYSLKFQLKAHRINQRLWIESQDSASIIPQMNIRIHCESTTSIHLKVQEEEFSRAYLERLYFNVLGTELEYFPISD